MRPEVVAAAVVEGGSPAASGVDGGLKNVASDLHGVATAQARKLDDGKIGINLPPLPLTLFHLSLSLFSSHSLSRSLSSCKRTAG